MLYVFYRCLLKDLLKCVYKVIFKFVYVIVIVNFDKKKKKYILLGCEKTDKYKSYKRI